MNKIKLFLLKFLGFFIPYFRRMFDKHKTFQDLKAIGQSHLSTWKDYMLNPKQEEKGPQHEGSFEKINLTDDFFDFSYLGTKYRLQIRIKPEQKHGLLELNKLILNREDFPNDIAIHLSELDVVFGVNMLKLVNEPPLIIVGGVQIPIGNFGEMRGQYFKQFDILTEKLALDEES